MFAAAQKEAKWRQDKKNKQTEEAENFICSGSGKRKEQGHLFVPSCVAKSLTEAILNDIGESLHSEELQEATGR